jgi:antitoxin (DNA-binding transcriptional repressor) of toxin-antitoxin stability system
MNASGFKAKCLALFDNLAVGGESITTLKRGKPIAQLVPPMYSEKSYPRAGQKASVTILEDIIEPPLPSSIWEAEQP